MFYKKENSPYRQPLEGVRFKSLAHGDKTHLTEFRLEKGSNIPMHAHPHEQTGYLISGKMRFTIADEIHVAETGDGWNIPGYVEHGVEVQEDALVIEVFSPVREDYL
jgi:quercetin dioxygenase-like cupin family protein